MGRWGYGTLLSPDAGQGQAVSRKLLYEMPVLTYQSYPLNLIRQGQVP